MEQSQERSTQPAVTHVNPHLDEVAVFFVMSTFGLIKKDAGLKYSFNPSSTDLSGKQAIGIRQSDLDEHVFGASGRDEESAFSKAVKLFKLEQDKRTRHLERFVNRTDSGGGKHPFDLATVVQAIHRYRQHSAEGIDWCMKVLESVWHDPNYFEHRPETYGTFFEQAGSAWLLNRFARVNAKTIYRRVLDSKLPSFAATMKEVGKDNDPALIKIAQFFREGCKGMLDVYALPRVIYSARKRFGMQTAFKLAGKALDAKYDGQLNFQKALVDIEEIGNVGSFGRFKAIYIETNNLETQRAILYSRKDIAVTIQRNPDSGHTQIFSNAQTGVKLKTLAAAIRLEELKLTGRPTDHLSQEELVSAGNSCGLDNWCLIVRHQDKNGAWKGSDMILNGGESHMGVAPTKIKPTRIRELTKECLLKQ